MDFKAGFDLQTSLQRQCQGKSPCQISKSNAT